MPRVPVGPVRERLAELRQTLVLREIAELTGVGFHQLDSMCRRDSRKTVSAAEAEAIMALDPSDLPLMESDAERFSPEKFKAVRLSQGYSMRALEVASGVANGQLHHWEAGRNTPRMWRLQTVLKVLGCGFDAVSVDSAAPGPEPVEPEPALPAPSRVDDFILAPYPCGVCGEGFRSRHMLAHHQHKRKKVSA